MRNKDMDDFAMNVYAAYGSFRIAGFEEDKAFSLANSFMVTMIQQQMPQPLTPVAT